MCSKGGCGELLPADRIGSIGQCRGATRHTHSSEADWGRAQRAAVWGLASAGNDAERCIRMITEKRATASHPATRSRRNDFLVALAAGIAIVLLLAGTSYAGKQTVQPTIDLASV